MDDTSFLVSYHEMTMKRHFVEERLAHSQYILINIYRQMLQINVTQTIDYEHDISTSAE